MSQATELLNSIPPAYTTTSKNEPHIVIDSNRVVTVPEELKRLAVQYDHCIEKITFDCPRYWDEHDMSKMHVYVNYLRSDGEKGSDLCTNVVVDKDDETMMHFDWEITGHLSAINGNIAFLACIMKSTPDGEIAERHWNSELNTDCYVSEGLEAAANIYAVQPGVIDALLTRMEAAEERTSEEAMFGYLETHFENNPQKVKDTIAEYLLRNNNGREHVYDYMRSYGQNHVDAFFDTQDDLLNFIDDYIHEHDYDVTTTVTVGDTSNKYIEEYDHYEIGDSMLGYTTSGPFFSRTYVCEIKHGDVIEFSKLINTEFEQYSPRFIITDDTHIVCDFIVTGDYPNGTTVRYKVEKDGYFYFTMRTLDRTKDTPIFYIKNKKEPNVVNIDKTLAFTDMAADAKVVGDRFNEIGDRFNEVDNKINSNFETVYDKKVAPLVETCVLADAFAIHKSINIPRYVTIGDTFDINSSLVDYTDYYVGACAVREGQMIDFNKSIMPSYILMSDIALIVVDRKKTVIDLVTMADLSVNKTYVFNCDGYCFMTGIMPGSRRGNIYEIRKFYDFENMVTTEQKPLLLDADMLASYNTDPMYGDETLQAIIDGRQVLVKTPNSKGGTTVCNYSPIYMYQIPNVDNNHLYLFYLRDEKNVVDLSALGLGTIEVPVYGELKMILSKTYAECPLK